MRNPPNISTQDQHLVSLEHLLVINPLLYQMHRWKYAEAYLEPCQKSKMERFEEIVNGLAVNYFPKRSILDIWQSSEDISYIRFVSSMLVDLHGQ